MNAKTEHVTRFDYCQYLLVSPINYTESFKIISSGHLKC